MKEFDGFVTPAGLATDLARNGGLGAARIVALRGMVDAGRTGRHVRARIHRRLTANNIGHWPAELPNDQSHLVLLYRTDLPAGAALAAALLLAQHESASGDWADVA